MPITLIKRHSNSSATRLKLLEMQHRDVGIADQQKAGKQGRDGIIKQFSTQPHPACN